MRSIVTSINCGYEFDAIFHCVREPE